jgi:hypothetical protein
MDRRAAGEMEIPHQESFLFSVFFGHAKGRARANRGFLAYSSRIGQWLVCQRFHHEGRPANAGGSG